MVATVTCGVPGPSSVCSTVSLRLKIWSAMGITGSWYWTVISMVMLGAVVAGIGVDVDLGGCGGRHWGDRVADVGGEDLLADVQRSAPAEVVGSDRQRSSRRSEGFA